jgi:hypothetical protein
MDHAMAAMGCATETTERCRLLGSEYRQAGFHALADFYRDNAKAAERWLMKAAAAYPAEVDHKGRPIRAVS